MNGRFLHWITLALSLSLVAALSAPPQRRPSGPHQTPLLPRKEFLKILGAAHIHLLADFFWIQTLQATGAARTKEEFRDIYYWADMVTDLDPKFRELYVFAGAAIVVWEGGIRYANTEESTRILEKGFRNVPDHILLGILYAYNLSAYHGRYKEAAEVATHVSKLPGAPPYLPQLATRLYAQSGDFDTGLELARSLAESAPDEETRQSFAERVKAIDLERTLRHLDAKAAEFQASTGRRASTVRELVDAGYLTSPPVDPFGGEITFTAEGRAMSTAQAKRLEIFRATEEREGAPTP